jgi:hypothetical protein
MLRDVNSTAVLHMPEENLFPNWNFTPLPEFVAIGHGAEMNMDNRGGRRK